MHFKIINPVTVTIDYGYEADSKQQWGGPWGSYPHVAVPEELDHTTVKVVSREEPATIVDVAEHTIPAVTHEETVVVIDTLEHTVPAVTHNETRIVVDSPETTNEDGTVIPAVTHEETVVVIDEPEHTAPAITHTETRVVVDSEAILVPAVTHEGTVTVYSFVIDPLLVATKSTHALQLRIGEAYERMDKDIYEQMRAVYGTSKSDSATAYYLTWQDMLAAPGAYVGGSLVDASTVTAYATEKLAAARLYAKWRMDRVVQFEAERKQIIEGGV